MNTYAIDQKQRRVYGDDNGFTRHCDQWIEVLQIEAARSGSALRAADARWPGKLHRARLIQPRAGGPCVLTTADRYFIRQLTTQTI